MLPDVVMADATAEKEGEDGVRTPAVEAETLVPSKADTTKDAASKSQNASGGGSGGGKKKKKGKR